MSTPKTAPEWRPGDEIPESVLDAVAAAIGDAYDCIRHWSAWSYGTMGPDDFHLVAENDDRVTDIAGAALEAAHAVLAAPPEQAAQPADESQPVMLNGLTEAEACATASVLGLSGAAQPADVAPIDMVLHCAACGVQHIDAPEPGKLISDGPNAGRVRPGWDNPPHRSHRCKACGHIWRPADVPTNGVPAVKTKGKADSPIRSPAYVALLQSALTALEYHRDQTRPIAQTDAVIEALRAALAAKGCDRG